MIRIAVCDDEVIFVRCLRDMVEALFEKQGMEFQCFVYTSAPELIRAHRKEEFQLLFLDIDMPEMSGMELAAEIRAMNSAAALIFVSSHSDFVFESFQFQPFRFLRKEWLAEELPDAVKAYCENYAKSGQTARLVLDDKRIVTKKLVEVVYLPSHLSGDAGGDRRTQRQRVHIGKAGRAVQPLWFPAHPQVVSAELPLCLPHRE